MSAKGPERSLLGSMLVGVLDVVFPPQCASCRSWGGFLCDGCEALMMPATGARCDICWQPGESPCRECRERRPEFDAARAAFAFEGAARDLVHALKYRGVSAVAPLMSAAMTSRLTEWAIVVEAVVPVPMAGSRRRRRGYNQAQLLAGEIGRALGLPVIKDMVRRRAGPSQVEQPSREARWRNAAQAYEAGRRANVSSVLVVDDAMTTGATLDACARVLKGVGVERVYGLTFARES